MTYPNQQVYFGVQVFSFEFCEKYKIMLMDLNLVQVCGSFSDESTNIVFGYT